MANRDEMKQCLLDVGLYDETLTEEELRTYYNTIKDSETSAMEESMHRNGTNTDENLFEVETQNMNEVEETYNEQVNSLCCNNNRGEIPRNDFRGVTVQPPLFKQECFLSKSTKERFELLYVYHTQLSRYKADLAKKSFFPAPLPPPIHISTSKDPSEPQQTYVSRSGRQTKRKNYNCEADDENSLEAVNEAATKKHKTDENEEWIEKRTIKPTKKKTKLEVEAKPEEQVSEETPQKSTSVSSLTPQSSKPVKKLSNQDIMKRSKLFDYSPKQKRSTRQEQLFDNMMTGMAEKQKKEELIEKFSDSLDIVEDVEEGGGKDVEQDEDFVRQRIVPKITARRTYKNTKKNKDFQALDVDIEPVVSNSKPEHFQCLRKNQKRVLEEVETVDCPICSRPFPKNEVETHAATCGEVEEPRITRSITRITCEVCDEVVLENYDEHLEECLKTAVAKK